MQLGLQGLGASLQTLPASQAQLSELRQAASDMQAMLVSLADATAAAQEAADAAPAGAITAEEGAAMTEEQLQEQLRPVLAAMERLAGERKKKGPLPALQGKGSKLPPTYRLARNLIHVGTTTP